MTTTLKLQIGIVLAIAIMVIGFVGLNSVHANPSAILEQKLLVGGAVQATTSPVFMTQGTGTTTISVDTQTYTPSADKLALAIQFSASSTGSNLRWRYEFANLTPGTDCTIATSTCDWYSQSTDLTSATAPATTTTEVQTFKEYSWVFASSTMGGVASSATNNRALKIVEVPALTRYARVIFYMASSSVNQFPPNGAVWAEFVQKTENR